MFGKTAPQTQPAPKQERHEQSFLQNGVRLKGEIEVDGDLRVEGHVEGALNTRGVLMIGPKASVDGELRGREIVIHGRVAGTIIAEQRIHLARGAKVKGDLHARSLVVEEGVFFEGRSHMEEPEGQKAIAASGGAQTGSAPPSARAGTGLGARGSEGIEGRVTGSGGAQHGHPPGSGQSRIDRSASRVDQVG